MLIECAGLITCGYYCIGLERWNVGTLERWNGRREAGGGKHEASRMPRTMQDENRHCPICHCEAASADLATRRTAAISLPWLDLDVPLLRQRADGKHEFLRDSFTCTHPPSMLADVWAEDVTCLASGGGQQSAVFSLLGARVTIVDLANGQLEGDRKAAARIPSTSTRCRRETFARSCFPYDPRLTDAGFYIYLLKAHVRLREAIPCVASDRIGQRHPSYSGKAFCKISIHPS